MKSEGEKEERAVGMCSCGVDILDLAERTGVIYGGKVKQQAGEPLN